MFTQLHHDINVLRENGLRNLDYVRRRNNQAFPTYEIKWYTICLIICEIKLTRI